jgi:hypothetical protein
VPLCPRLKEEFLVFGKPVLIMAALLIPATGWSRQDSSALSAKTLYYQAETDEEKPPAKSPAKPATRRPVKPATTDQSAQASNQPVGTPVVAMVEHLGLRYNLLRYDRQTRKSVAVDPQHVFEQGDCLQVQLSPNRDGYLYVFDQGSSGKWQVLLPSALMADEVNIIKSKETVKVPANSCFTVENPSGTEHLFLVLSRSQEDVYSLDRAIRSKSPAASTNMNMASKTDNSNSMLEGQNRLDTEIQKMREGLGSRDLGVEKIGEPDKPDEPADSVYVVNTSSVSSSRLVTEIQIRHQ